MVNKVNPNVKTIFSVLKHVLPETCFGTVCVDYFAVLSPFLSKNYFDNQRSAAIYAELSEGWARKVHPGSIRTQFPLIFRISRMPISAEAENSLQDALELPKATTIDQPGFPERNG